MSYRLKRFIRGLRFGLLREVFFEHDLKNIPNIEPRLPVAMKVLGESEISKIREVAEFSDQVFNKRMKREDTCFVSEKIPSGFDTRDSVRGRSFESRRAPSSLFLGRSGSVGRSPERGAPGAARVNSRTRRREEGWRVPGIFFRDGGTVSFPSLAEGGRGGLRGRREGG